MCMPPSTAIVAPVMNELSAQARNRTQRAISSGQACRDSGILASNNRAATSGGAPVADTSVAPLGEPVGLGHVAGPEEISHRDLPALPDPPRPIRHASNVTNVRA
jgi:hypothetical protein